MFCISIILLCTMFNIFWVILNISVTFLLEKNSFFNQLLVGVLFYAFIFGSVILVVNISCHEVCQFHDK